MKINNIITFFVTALIAYVIYYNYFLSAGNSQANTEHSVDERAVQVPDNSKHSFSASDAQPVESTGTVMNTDTTINTLNNSGSAELVPAPQADVQQTIPANDYAPVTEEPNQIESYENTAQYSELNSTLEPDDGSGSDTYHNTYIEPSESSNAEMDTGAVIETGTTE